jgi:hypothetical protein
VTVNTGINIVSYFTFVLSLSLHIYKQIYLLLCMLSFAWHSFPLVVAHLSICVFYYSCFSFIIITIISFLNIIDTTYSKNGQRETATLNCEISTVWATKPRTFPLKTSWLLIWKEQDTRAKTLQAMMMLLLLLLLLLLSSSSS